MGGIRSRSRHHHLLYFADQLNCMAAVETAEKPDAQPAGSAPKWLLFFVSYFFFGLINGTVIGLTPENEHLNGLAQILFFWSPIIVCITIARFAANKRKKMLLLLAAFPTLWFAVLPTVMSGAWNMLTRGNNPSVSLVSESSEGEWEICQYHFTPKGFGEPNDYQTREKSVGFGFKIVRKI